MVSFDGCKIDCCTFSIYTFSASPDAAAAIVLLLLLFFSLSFEHTMSVSISVCHSTIKLKQLLLLLSQTFFQSWKVTWTTCSLVQKEEGEEEDWPLCCVAHWQFLRAVLSSFFSSAKCRRMFSFTAAAAAHLTLTFSSFECHFFNAQHFLTAFFLLSRHNTVDKIIYHFLFV